MIDRGGFVHGTAFLIGEIGLIAVGLSGAGKSMLAAGVSVSTLGPSFRLVADDRAHVTVTGGRLVVRPVAGFLGMIEIRGFGMARLPAMPSAIVRGIVRLIPVEPERIPDHPVDIEDISGIRLPVLALRQGADCATRFLTKWPHFRAVIETR